MNENKLSHVILHVRIPVDIAKRVRIASIDKYGTTRKVSRLVCEYMKRGLEEDGYNV